MKTGEEMSNLALEELDPIFQNGFKFFVKQLFGGLKPKELFGTSLTGDMLAQQAEAYCDAKIPVVEDSFNAICRNQCQEFIDEVTKWFKSELDAIDPFP